MSEERRVNIPLRSAPAVTCRPLRVVDVRCRPVAVTLAKTKDDA